jgi:hypothetical protein
VTFVPFCKIRIFASLRKIFRFLWLVRGSLRLQRVEKGEVTLYRLLLERLQGRR